MALAPQTEIRPKAKENKLSDGSEDSIKASAGDEKEDKGDRVEEYVTLSETAAGVEMMFTGLKVSRSRDSGYASSAESPEHCPQLRFPQDRRCQRAVVICSEKAIPEAEKVIKYLDTCAVSATNITCTDASCLVHLPTEEFTCCYLLVDSAIFETMMVTHRDAFDVYFKEAAKAGIVVYCLCRTPSQDDFNELYYHLPRACRRQVTEVIIEQVQEIVKNTLPSLDLTDESDRDACITNREQDSCVPSNSHEQDLSSGSDCLEKPSFFLPPTDDDGKADNLDETDACESDEDTEEESGRVFVQVGGENTVYIPISTSGQLVMTQQTGHLNTVSLKIVPGDSSSKVIVVLTADPQNPALEKLLSFDVTEKKEVINIKLASSNASLVDIRTGSVILELEVARGQTIGPDWLDSVIRTLLSEVQLAPGVSEGSRLRMDINTDFVMPMDKLGEYLALHQKLNHQNCVPIEKYKELEQEHQKMKLKLEVARKHVKCEPLKKMLRASWPQMSCEKALRPPQSLVQPQVTPDVLRKLKGQSLYRKGYGSLTMISTVSCRATWPLWTASRETGNEAEDKNGCFSYVVTSKLTYRATWPKGRRCKSGERRDHSPAPLTLTSNNTRWSVTTDRGTAKTSSISPCGQSKLIKAHLPHNMISTVIATAGVTLKDAFQKRLGRRGLDLEKCLIFKHEQRHPLAWSTDLWEVAGEELVIETLDTEDVFLPHQLERRKAFPPTSCDVCHQSLVFSGFRCQRCDLKFHQRCEHSVNPSCYGDSKRRLTVPSRGTRARSEESRSASSSSDEDVLHETCG